MTRTQDEQVVELYMKEYDKIKAEQIQRMGFRDNLIYATLIAITGIVSIVVDDVAKIPVLLVLPLACMALGWTYLVNDEKISALGRYIRLTFTDEIRALIHSDDPGLFGWEIAHRSDPNRISRKIIQFFVDEIVFVMPGLIAILIFLFITPTDFLWLRWIAGLETLALLLLGWQIFSYADLQMGK
jgi:hypothetical protein